MRFSTPADGPSLTPDTPPVEGAALPAAAAGAASEPVLPPALQGETITFGGVSCYVAGRGPPLVLVHSVNAVPSAAEVRPIFEDCSATRTAFAVDLPGFGLSDRSDRRYDPRLMTDALHALAHQVRKRCGAVPIDALAASLGCEFLARAAVEQPTRWGRLAFVSPTGLDGRTVRRGPPGSTRAMPWLHSLFTAGPWAQALYGLLTRPAVVRYFLQRTWGSRSIDETLWAYDVLTARRPGARFAPLHFLAGRLFSKDIHRIYASVSRPVWMSHGVRGDFKDFHAKGLVDDRGRWQTTVYPTGALPYFEVPAAFLADFDAFLTSGSPARPLTPARTERPTAPA